VRDITELQDAGFDIEVAKRDGRSIARLTSERNYSPVSITKRERFTLLAVRSIFDVLRGTPLHDDVISVLAKLEQRLNTAERAEAASLRERFAYVPDGGTKTYADKEDIIDAIQTGIFGRKVVRYSYKDARGRAKRGYLAPFALLLYRHGLYAVGARGDDAKIDTADWRQSIGVLAVERFTDAERLRERTFDVPADFKIDEVLHGAFGIHVGEPGKSTKVVVEFSSEKAAHVQARAWHPTQTIERTSEGRIRLSLTVANLEPLVSWVLEWGTSRACDRTTGVGRARRRRARRRLPALRRQETAAAVSAYTLDHPLLRSRLRFTTGAWLHRRDRSRLVRAAARPRDGIWSHGRKLLAPIAAQGGPGAGDAFPVQAESAGERDRRLRVLRNVLGPARLARMGYVWPSQRRREPRRASLAAEADP
jgi:predicted DNA-binding transcriptional regulator YafY